MSPETSNSEINLKEPEPLAVPTEVACKMLGGVSKTTLWRLEKRGKLRSVRSLRHKRWPVSQLKRLVEEL